MMKRLKEITVSTFALTALIAIITAFSNQPETKKTYEFETITVVESLIQSGLGRSRMISGMPDIILDRPKPL